MKKQNFLFFSKKMLVCHITALGVWENALASMGLFVAMWVKKRFCHMHTQTHCEEAIAFDVFAALML